ncbi:MAG: hypothetical protein CVU41_07160 [Chloroflexi bacterium HGW-Chloroflexi-3]|nr:MAG: hypothetical protein CVU41_07160 [Chloroflexi bacterium HGW-Chloroflexi-3]
MIFTEKNWLLTFYFLRGYKNRSTNPFLEHSMTFEREKFLYWVCENCHQAVRVLYWSGRKLDFFGKDCLC